MTSLCDMKHFGRFYADNLKEKQLSRLRQIQAFYTDELVKTVLIPICKQTFVVSLRAIDWLVTNYAKRYRVVIKVPSSLPISIYSSYRDTLKFFKRKCFDTFRRRERIYFKDVEDGAIIHTTTVSQLNFFRWAIMNGILDYAVNNANEIEKDMLATLNHSRKRKREKKTTKKRSELVETTHANKCVVYEVQHLVEFDM